MDINEIIASGILEMYVLGLTSAEETRHVEELRALHPRVNDEISRIEENIAAYMQQYDRETPEGLKDRIIKEINAGKVVELPHRAGNGTRWAKIGFAASVALLAGSIFMNVTYYNRWQQTKQQVARLESESQGLTAQMDAQRASMGKYESELEVLKSASIRMVSLNSVKPEMKANVMVYWDTAANNVFVNVNNLPAPPDGMQYQLWALMDGQPIDAGLMELTPKNLQKLKTIQKAQAFAITLEKRGGSPTPTLSQLVVMGNV